MSHSVHLSPAPDAGPFFESRSAHHRVALSSATPPSLSQTANAGGLGSKINDWFPQMEPGKRSHTGGLRDGNSYQKTDGLPPLKVPMN